MRFLCLHGNGANSSVFDVQTAALRHELEDGHIYEFVEGTLEAPMVEGVEAMSAPGHSFYAFYDPRDLSTLSSALSQLDDYISAEGPFDAIMAFSAGAVLATAYLLQKQAAEESAKTMNEMSASGLGRGSIQCAVFLASAEPNNELRYLGIDWERMPLRIPTAHIWGFRDETAPIGGESLCRTCDATLQYVTVHEGGHEVPRMEALSKAVHTIRRAVHLAEERMYSAAELQLA